MTVHTECGLVQSCKAVQMHQCKQWVHSVREECCGHTWICTYCEHRHWFQWMWLQQMHVHTDTCVLACTCTVQTALEALKYCTCQRGITQFYLPSTLHNPQLEGVIPAFNSQIWRVTTPWPLLHPTEGRRLGWSTCIYEQSLIPVLTGLCLMSLPLGQTCMHGPRDALFKSKFKHDTLVNLQNQGSDKVGEKKFPEFSRLFPELQFYFSRGYHKKIKRIASSQSG